MQGKQTASGSKPLKLSQRSIDYLLLVWYAVFWFTVTWTDLHNFTASLLGVEVKDLEHMTLVYPPKWLSDFYFKWARTVDPLLYQNPVWWQCIEWVNLLCLMPFSVVALYAFAVGARWIRLPAIIVSSFTFYSLIMCIGTTLFGPERSANPVMFFWIYVPYLIFPAIVVARVWPDEPFSKPLPARLDAVLKFASTATFAMFLSYVIKWFVTYEPTVLPASLLPYCTMLSNLLP